MLGKNIFKYILFVKNKRLTYSVGDRLLSLPREDVGEQGAQTHADAQHV